MLKFFNTLTRKKEEFKPLKGKEVDIYACGPTVYNYAHIGNLRTYIFEDVLRKTLIYNNYKVKEVMNITDVGHLVSDADVGEDKVEAAARKEKKSAWDIAEFYAKAFKQDLKRLNIMEPDEWCKATDTIEEQIEFVKGLEDKGFTYKTADGIYFDTSGLKDYGKLAKLNIEGLKVGKRVKQGEKKNVTDFALWKFSPEDEKRQMEWDSPWGKGFPGWHIECSAIAKKYFGDQFDIHVGGIDHVPIHHTNEIAQGEALTGKVPARYWLHGEFLLLDKGKMAKSKGEFIALQTLIDKGYNPLSFRYLCMEAHYRSKLNFSWKSLDAAQNALNNLYNKVRELDGEDKVLENYQNEFLNTINDDLDTPKALTVVWKLLKSNEDAGAKKSTLLYFDKVLGLGLSELKRVEIPEKVRKLVDEREEARKNKDWNRADELRNYIKKMGYDVEDTKEKTKIRKLRN